MSGHSTRRSTSSITLGAHRGTPGRSSSRREIEALESRRFLSISFSEVDPLSPPLANQLPAKPTWAVAKDFNGDGHQDIAVSCNDSNKLAVRFGDGTGRFYARSPADLRDYSTVGSTSCIATADLDGTNGPDLAVSLHGTSLIQIFLNDGTGQFASAGTIPVGNDPLGIVAGDMNADNKPDLLVTSNADDGLTVLINTGAAHFMQIEPRASTGDGPVGLDVADLDGDDDLDVIVANHQYGANTLSIFLGNGQGCLDPGFLVQVSDPLQYANPFWVRAGDLDGDHVPDLVVTNYVDADPLGHQPAGITVLRGFNESSDPDGPPYDFQWRRDYLTGNAPVGVSLGDFDGDSTLDVAVANSLTPSISIFRGNGDGALELQPNLTVTGGAPAVPVIVDMDADGLNDLAVADNGANRLRVYLNTTEPPPGVICGTVWLDFNNNAEVDFGEKGIEGVEIRLTGPVTRTTFADPDGAYIFDHLPAGTYCVEEIQPVEFADGKESLGTCGGVVVVNDKFCSIPVAESHCCNYNFGERPLPNGAIVPGQTATIGFWQNKNGQNLIKAFDDSPTATRLGDWLAATLPNLFGANAGASSLAGLTNTQVAEQFRQRFILKGVKVDAQVMATALSVYATTQSLGGPWAAGYGFTVSAYGLANSTFSVGVNGAAFGVGNGTMMTVLDLLQAADARAVNGVLYGGNATLRRMCNDVFSAINEAGDR